MARKPFDPDLVEVPQQELPFTSAQAARVLRVAELTRLIQTVLAGGLPRTLHVVGELSNVARPASGHLYFTLKDSDSEVRCVMWRSAASGLRFRPEDGMELVATGYVDVYPPRGQYQLYVRRLEPRGVGALELAFRQLCEKLAKEGLFDPAHKKPLPRHPATVAVVTSPTGAAIRDIIRTVQRRFPCVRLLVAPVRVQGEGAAGEIATAIERLDRQRQRLGGIDVMIVGRGGGSLEDLWAFNEEVVARAIYACKIPVISAVGHEVDTTVADLVADVRAATPTAAAELVVPVLDDLVEDLAQHGGRLTRAVRSAVQVAQGRVRAASRCEFLRDPIARIRQRDQQVDEVVGRLRLAVAHRMEAVRRRLHECAMSVARIQPQAYVAHKGRTLAEVEHRLYRAQWARQVVASRHVEAAVAALARAWPMKVVARHQAMLEHIGPRLARGVDVRTRRAGEWVTGFAKRLEAGSHKSVLNRGFSITRRADNEAIVTDPGQVAGGTRIRTDTRGGKFDSEVVEGESEGANS